MSLINCLRTKRIHGWNYVRYSSALKSKRFFADTGPMRKTGGLEISNSSAVGHKKHPSCMFPTVSHNPHTFLLFSTTSRFTPPIQRSLFSLQRKSFLKTTLPGFSTLGLIHSHYSAHHQHHQHHQHHHHHHHQQQPHIKTMSTAQAPLPNILKWANDKTGEFKRQVSTFRDAIVDEPGAKFPPEA